MGRLFISVIRLWNIFGIAQVSGKAKTTATRSAKQIILLGLLESGTDKVGSPKTTQVVQTFIPETFCGVDMEEDKSWFGFFKALYDWAIRPPEPPKPCSRKSPRNGNGWVVVTPRSPHE